jgi:hypothetical protein
MGGAYFICSNLAIKAKGYQLILKDWLNLEDQLLKP